MRSRFVGGTWDGRITDTPGARYHMVPMYPEIGSVEEFSRIDLDDEGKPMCKPTEIQRYRRASFDSVTKTVTYVLDEQGAGAQCD